MKTFLLVNTYKFNDNSNNNFGKNLYTFNIFWFSESDLLKNIIGYENILIWCQLSGGGETADFRDTQGSFLTLHLPYSNISL